MVGALLRRLRQRRGFTLVQTAARAGVSPQYLSELERGLKDPSSEILQAVAGALGLTLIDLTLAVAAELHRLDGRAPESPRVRAAAFALAA